MYENSNQCKMGMNSRKFQNGFDRYIQAEEQRFPWKCILLGKYILN